MYSAGFLDHIMEEGGAEAPKMVDRKKVRKLYETKFPEFLRLVGSAAYSTKDKIGDVDLVSTSTLDKVLKWFEERYTVESVQKLGNRIMTMSVRLLSKEPTKVNVWYSTKEELPFMLFAYSYPRQFVIAMRRKFKSMGWRLSQYDLKDKGGERKTVKYIQDIFKLAKIEYRTPAEEGEKLNL
jgi:DNA polymerase/3'-5' exonuclease PolX